MNRAIEAIGCAFGLLIAGALLVMIGAFLIGIGPVGWIILFLMLTSQ